MFGLKKPFNKPAKLAERVLAPGDGEAEPGELSRTHVSAHELGDRSKGERKKLGPGFFITILLIQSVASFAGSLNL